MKWITPKEQQEARILICEICPHFRSKTRTCGKPVVGNQVEHNGKKVRLCGCFLDAKTNLSFSSCPIGKWGTEEKDLKELKEAETFVFDLMNSSRVERKDLNRAYGIFKDLLGHTKSSGNCPPCIKADMKAILNKIENIKKEL